MCPPRPLCIDKTHRLNIKHSHKQVYIKLYNTCCSSKLSSRITLRKSRFWYDRVYYRVIWIGDITRHYNPPSLEIWQAIRHMRHWPICKRTRHIVNSVWIILPLYIRGRRHPVHPCSSSSLTLSSTQLLQLSSRRTLSGDI
jgi:hypothetical protein